jgi:hypothetical protein
MHASGVLRLVSCVYDTIVRLLADIEHMQSPAEITYRVFMFNVMVAMMDVDRRIEELEFERVCDIYEEIVGFGLEAELRTRLIDSAILNRRQVLELVKNHGARLSANSRDLVMKAAASVGKVDEHFDHREERFLRDLGTAFELSWEAVQNLAQDVSSELGWTFPDQ